MIIIAETTRRLAYYGLTNISTVVKGARTMKRYKSYKALKRPKFLTRPVATADLPEIDANDANAWLLQHEKRETKQLRRFRQQHA